MSADKIILGRTVRDLDESPSYDPISYIRLITGTDQNGNQIVYTAGDPKSGRTLDVENRLIRDPTLGQQVADDILQAVQGYAYKPFSASGAILDPAAEIGDGVSVDEVYSVLADIETTFSPLMSANIGAPEHGSIDHEYPFESSENRLIAQEIQGLRTSFIVENGRIAAEISDVQQTQKGLSSKVTSLELTVDGIHAYTDQEIQTISGGVVHDWAELNFTPQNIKSQVSSYFDAAGAASAALADSKTYTDGKIAPISAQYTSAIEQSAKEIKATVAAQEVKWDLSTLSDSVRNNIIEYGYVPQNGAPDNSTARGHSGKYFLDQAYGRLYRSNGTSWVPQNITLTQVTSSLQSQITNQAGRITSTISRVSDVENRVSQIEQTEQSITMSVSSSNGLTTFQLLDGSAVLDTKYAFLTVDTAHITGTIIADAVRANMSIVAPTLFSPDYSEYLTFGSNGRYYGLVLNNNRGDQVFSVYDGDFGIVSFSAKNYAYMRVNSENATQIVYAYGTWDFRNARVLLPS